MASTRLGVVHAERLGSQCKGRRRVTSGLGDRSDPQGFAAGLRCLSEVARRLRGACLTHRDERRDDRRPEEKCPCAECPGLEPRVRATPGGLSRSRRALGNSASHLDAGTCSRKSRSRSVEGHDRGVLDHWECVLQPETAIETTPGRPLQPVPFQRLSREVPEHPLPVPILVEPTHQPGPVPGQSLVGGVQGPRAPLNASSRSARSISMTRCPANSSTSGTLILIGGRRYPRSPTGRNNARTRLPVLRVEVLVEHLLGRRRGQGLPDATGLPVAGDREERSPPPVARCPTRMRAESRGSALTSSPQSADEQFHQHLGFQANSCRPRLAPRSPRATPPRPWAGR